MQNDRLAAFARAIGAELIVNRNGPTGSLRASACKSGCAEAGEVWKFEPGVVGYPRVTNDHFTETVQSTVWPSQHKDGLVSNGNKSPLRKAPVLIGLRDTAESCDSGDLCEMGDTGLEHHPVSSDVSAFPSSHGAEAGATVTTDADLRCVIDAWSKLPEALRAGITALVLASFQQKDSTQ